MRACLAAFTSGRRACVRIRWAELWRITYRHTRCVRGATSETTRKIRFGACAEGGVRTRREAAATLVNSKNRSRRSLAREPDLGCLHARILPILLLGRGFYSAGVGL